MSIFRTAAAREALRQIRDICARQEGEEIPYAENCRLEVEKWRFVHELLAAHPFPTRQRLARSEQWREAFARVRDIAEDELHSWLLLQIEVAANIERGVREMRPRKAGPCHPQIVEFARQRLAKAEKILSFATEGEREGGVNAVDGDWHERTLNILKKAGRAYDPYDHAGHEEVPWPVRGHKG